MSKINALIQKPIPLPVGEHVATAVLINELLLKLIGNLTPKLVLRVRHHKRSQSCLLVVGVERSSYLVEAEIH